MLRNEKYWEHNKDKIKLEGYKKRIKLVIGSPPIEY